MRRIHARLDVTDALSQRFRLEDLKVVSGAAGEDKGGKEAKDGQPIESIHAHSSKKEYGHRVGWVNEPANKPDFAINVPSGSLTHLRGINRANEEGDRA
jgi:hypothetical protein